MQIEIIWDMRQKNEMTILGPLLFILLINDLPNACELTDPPLFAVPVSFILTQTQIA